MLVNPDIFAPAFQKISDPTLKGMRYSNKEKNCQLIFSKSNNFKLLSYRDWFVEKCLHIQNNFRYGTLTIFDLDPNPDLAQMFLILADPFTNLQHCLVIDIAIITIN